jgi:hypothetical protein
MAVVKGIREKVHLPLYDSISVKSEEQWRKDQGSSTLKFFVDVQGKTKLETNMQSASQLSHYNTFEARAMRVVLSDLPPEFPEDVTAEDVGFDVVDDSTDENPFLLDMDGNIGAVDENEAIEDISEDDFDIAKVPLRPILADIEIGLDRIVELLQKAKASSDGFAALFPDDDEVTLRVEAVTLEDDSTEPETELDDSQAETLAEFGGAIWLSTGDLEFLLEQIPERERPLQFQVEKDTDVVKFINKFIYNTVTTFYVGEKVMIQMPTYFFPSGAGALNGHAASHGEPDPTATFRFAEAINIDKQQNFRVEIEVPDSDVLKELQRIYGPLFIWVILDGYMTRDVQ